MKILEGTREWIISYKSSESKNINTLRDFFEKAIPNKNEYLQEYLMHKDNSKRKTCFDFCYNTIERLELKKKKEKL